MSSETNQEVMVEIKKKNNTFKYIIIFVIFFAIGVSGGIFGAIKYKEYKEEKDYVPEEIIDQGPKDITEEKESQELINSLYSVINGNVMFYTTKGVSVSTMDNTSKLTLVYNYLNANKIGTSETLQSAWIGSFTCFNESFITDSSDNPLVSTNKCTVTRINKNEFINANKKLFNDEILDTSVSFSPIKGKNCVVDGESYLCGNIADNSGITGELESKFTIEKVTKSDDGTVEIYEKGYLVDKRSNINNPNDQYDNYYLHSSDSTEYYYELKSADNLTFKHTFKSINNNYYYVSTELVKE